MAVHSLISSLARDPWQRRLALATSIVLVLLIARAAAGLTWSLIAPPPLDDSGPAAGAMTTATSVAVDPARVAGRHIFGRADGERDRSVIDAPDTQLNLTLRGIAAASSDDASRALIAGPDGRERVYAIGATLPGGATIHRVLPDRVLLDRRGTLETLRLPRDSIGDSPAPRRTAGADGDAEAPAFVDNLRGQADAEALAEFVRPQPVLADGRLRGYRVYPGRDRQRFAALGLRAGDLVTAVNGMPLDTESGIDTLRLLGGTEQVTLTIERGGRVENVTVRLDR